MFIEILVAILVGVTLGIFTGLIPGIHINLVAAVILSVSPFLLRVFSVVDLAVLIIAMSITHVFIDFIPSIFLGAPSDATALAVLPGHKLLMEGRGYEAIVLSAIGGFFGVIGIVILVPLLLLVVKIVFVKVQGSIGIILLGIVLYNIIREKFFINKLWSLVIFMLAGLLGVMSLNIPNLQQPLLPLLSGLFGVSTLITSLTRNVGVPIQVNEIKDVKKSNILKSVITGAFSGGFMGIFPALGPAQAAVLARNIIGSTGKRAYLITLGAVSTSSMLFGLITLFTIDRARNGSIAIMSEIIEIGINEFILLIIVAMVTAGIAYWLTLLIGRFFASNIYRIDYRKISYVIILFIAAITIYFSQAIGLLILTTGAAIGIIAITKGLPRHNLMGCLMLPVMIFYLG